MANPDIDTNDDSLSYRIPLVSTHKYHTANINALCNTCVSKIHKEIDAILKSKNLQHDPPCNHYPRPTYSEYAEFEIVVDGVVTYEGRDPKAIKQAMAVKAVKPDTFATPWIRIADVKQVGNGNITINGEPYKVTHRNIKKPLVSKVINGYKTQAIDYVASLNGDKTYTIAIGV